MIPLVIGLVLCAALLHATWNAILRGGADRLWSMTVMCAVSAVVALPFLFFLPLPAQASWPCIGLSAAPAEVSYCLFLVRAYREGGLAQVYPIARGTSPLLVTLGAVFRCGRAAQRRRRLQGVALVSLGIMALAFGEGAAERPLDPLCSRHRRLRRRLHPDRRRRRAAVGARPVLHGLALPGAGGGHAAGLYHPARPAEVAAARG